MAKVTLKIVQKYESNSEGKYVVRLRITANRISRFIATAVEVTQAQFNKKGKRELLNWIRPNHPNAEVFNATLRKLWDRAVVAVDQVGAEGTAEAVKKILEQPTEQPTTESTAPVDFLAYCGLYIKRRGESTTTDTYLNAINAFKNFLRTEQPEGELKLPFSDLNIVLLKRWRSWALGVYKNNSAWLLHSRLKSMYFQALEDVEGITSLPAIVADPFRRVKITKQKTKKVRLYEDEIDRLMKLDLPWNKLTRRARDICIMMYYAHGMRVGDALNLRLRNYVIIETPTGSQHRLIYTMSKTGKPKNVLLPPQCVELLNPYRAICKGQDDTLFPFLRRYVNAGFSDYQIKVKIKSKAILIREGLIQLTKLAGIEKAISAHTFRHSFADLARRNNMDLMTIKKALGHEQLNTTQGYLDDLEESAVDSVSELFA